MKKNGLMKSSPKPLQALKKLEGSDPRQASKKHNGFANRNEFILQMIRAYFSTLWLTHKNLGPLRIIGAYFFFAFALLSLYFTIVVPITSGSIIPTWWGKVESRIITFGMMIANTIVYSIIVNWKRKGSPLAIRIAFIAIVIYLNISLLIRTVYELMRGGSFI